MPRIAPNPATDHESGPHARAAPDFDRLYEDSFESVWRTLRALGVSPASLDDAVQDVFLAVHRQLPGFEGRSSARTWICGIACRVASNYRRREQRKGGLLPLDPAMTQKGPDPEDRLRLREALAAKIAGSAAVVGTGAIAANARPLRQFLRSNVGALSTVVAVTGTVAFGAGYFTGHRTRSVIVRTVTITRPEPAAPSAAPVSPETLTKPSLASSFDLGHSGARPRVAASIAPSASLPADSLSGELELLRRAERTIRSGNSQVALGLLDELDAQFPKGQLLEERTAARVMARCQLDDEDGARARGNAYLLAHTQSVYADRVRTLCHIDSAISTKDSPKTGDQCFKEQRT